MTIIFVAIKPASTKDKNVSAFVLIDQSVGNTSFTINTFYRRRFQFSHCFREYNLSAVSRVRHQD